MCGSAEIKYSGDFELHGFYVKLHGILFALEKLIAAIANLYGLFIQSG